MERVALKLIDWIRNLSRTKTTVSAADSSTDGVEIDPFNPFPEPVEIEITDVIDLHTIPPRDVKRVVEEYLFQAHEAGFRSVRIIHGKGIGVQQRMVRSILAKNPFVQDWTDAPPEAGGLGATIVRFRKT
ncbi:MAG TPA: Smr/MutS family protein [Pyrinomonadaceae bacterium]|nr:Smr/MutS family protein [Pyrinomonadaceae bacterium]